MGPKGGGDERSLLLPPPPRSARSHVPSSASINDDPTGPGHPSRLRSDLGDLAAGGHGDGPAPAPGHPPQHRVYASRFWVLFLFAQLCMCNNAVWATYNTVLAPTRSVYGVSTDQVDFLGALGPLGYLVAAPLNVYLTERFGLRTAVLWGLLATALACTVRMLPHFVLSSPERPQGWYLVLAGQALNAAGGPAAGASASLLSSSWFPLRERSTAMTVGYLAQIVGVAIAFKLGPALVGDTHVLRLLIVELAWAGAILLLAVAYFPSRPPSPPSPSAEVARLGFRCGMWLLVSNRRFLFLSLAISTCGGVLLGWNLLLDSLLERYFDEATIGWIGLIPNAASPLIGIPIGLWIDHANVGFKWVIVAEMLLTALAFLAFLYFSRGAGNPHALFATSLIGLTVAGIIGSPALEFAVEQSFPVSEDLSAGFINFFWNAFGGVFILCKAWLSNGVLGWTVVGSYLAFGLGIALLLPNDSRRRSLDRKPGRGAGGGEGGGGGVAGGGGGGAKQPLLV